ncbi:hypothetical protein [Bacillus sp. OTU2372]|uniref:hypothetical protein n=1 Tax=Bacillus sp. OTU2372 TaxID=3043858 RepID=UPI00313AADF8
MTTEIEKLQEQLDVTATEKTFYNAMHYIREFLDNLYFKNNGDGFAKFMYAWGMMEVLYDHPKFGEDAENIRKHVDFIAEKLGVDQISFLFDIKLKD